MHDHAHAHGHGAGSIRGGRALSVALVLTAAYTAIEAVGGILTGSLALLADAGHMLSDNVALALALFAAWLAARPPTAQKTFGYRRAEILAALANGVTLVAISIWVFVEAGRRLSDPPDVLGGWMLAIAIVGLAVNLAAGGVLLRSRRESLNVDAAFRHVVADALGSFGVIAAAAAVLATGWTRADPLAGLVIGLLVLASAWTILRDATRILLEAAPEGVDPGDVGRRLAQVGGVVDVHDLHIWTITSGFPALSAHVLVEPGADCHRIRLELERLLGEEFGLGHTTIQVDHAGARRGLEVSRLR